MTHPTASPTIGVQEAAEILRCGLPTVQRLIETGELPALQLNQRHTVRTASGTPLSRIAAPS